MNNKLFTIITLLILTSLMLIGCAPADGSGTADSNLEPPVSNDDPVGGNDATSAGESGTDDSANTDANANTDDDNIGLANPASIYCEEQGGTLEIRSDAEGNQYGACIFADGSECEEWAFFRGECAPGGIQLFDTLWILQGIGGKALVAGTVPTLRITPDWELNGSTGCNSFFGSASHDGESWEVGPLGSTEMWCEGVMDQETAVFSHLQKVTHHTLSADTLTLHSPDGDLVYALAQNTALEETIWGLVSITQGDAVVSTRIDSEIYIEFKEGTVSGSTGCNIFSGSYEVEGDSLTLSTLALTRRACDEEHSAREFELVQALDQVAGFRTEMDTLTLVDAAGETVATFVANQPPAELAGTSWELITYGGQSVLSDTPATIDFTEDGQLSGNAGCNRFFGSYELEAGNFSVGPLGSTDMWCGDAMDQEDAVLRMLQSATNLIHDGDKLIINTGEGEMVLRLAP